jgi:cephalosporin hydroxylase
MLKQVIKRAAYRVFPRWAKAVDLWFWERKLARKQTHMARELRAEVEGRPIDEVVDMCLRHEAFSANQKHAEITALLRVLCPLPPRVVLEIGAFKGGTLFLFSTVAAPDASLLSIDLGFVPRQLRVYPHFARRGQHIQLLAADSHAEATLKRVRKWLNGRMIDVLFIDGDHSFLGVSRDYEMYSPFVRKGGVIAFHDIVPDYWTRYGTRTPFDTGEVPRFWSGLRAAGGRVEEFIADPAQDGYGIGVLYK